MGRVEGGGGGKRWGYDNEGVKLGGGPPHLTTTGRATHLAVAVHCLQADWGVGRGGGGGC